MHGSFSRICSHALLATAVVVAGWLVVEWLLPGAITTAIPLYETVIMVAVGVLRLAPYLWRGSVRFRWVGRMAALIPAVMLASAFALNERNVFVIVGGVGVSVLVGIVALGGEGVPDSLE